MGIAKGNMFNGLPQAALGRGVTHSESVYVKCAARLGTLNSKIPSLSDVVYESRIWGEVVS